MTETRGLRWLHVLVFAGLAAVGAGAGDIVFVVHDVGGWGEVQGCALVSGLPPDGGGLARVIGRGAEYDRCATTFDAVRLSSRAGGMVAVIALAGLLMVLGGLLQHRRVRRRIRRRRPPGEAAAARITAAFDGWCDTLWLRGRQRPRLLVLPVGDRYPDAYTTKVPFGRASVVVPVELAFDRTPGKLDLVLLHELGHVRARDVTWASATWWAGWLTVPVLLLAMAPALVTAVAREDYRDLAAAYALSLPTAAALAAGTLFLRTAVLRRREHSADRFAVAHYPGGRAALAPAGEEKRPGGRAALAPAGEEKRRPAGRAALAPVTGEPRRTLRRLLDTHPPRSQRFAALDRVDSWEGGFLVAAAVGLFAAYTFHTLRRVGDTLPGPVAALVWAGILIPLWARRPAPGRRQWWARVLGSAAGLLAGYLLPGPGQTEIAYGFFYEGFVLGALAAAIPLLIGAGALAAGLAEAAATVTGRARRATAVALAVTGLTLTVAGLLSAGHLVVFAHFNWGTVAIDRMLFTTPTGQGLAAALGLAAAAAVGLVLGERRSWRGPVVASVLAVAAAAPAIVLLTDHVVASGGDDYHAVHTAWLLCAATGLVVALMILVARGARGTAAAVAAGFLTAAASGMLQVAWDAHVLPGPIATGYVAGFQERPWWLLTALIVVTAPVAVLAHDLVRAAGRAGWRWAALAVPAVLVTTATIAAGWTEPVTGAPGDLARLQNAEVEATGRAGERAGRPLTTEEAAGVLAATRRQLPATWVEQAAPRRVVAGVLPARCGALFAAGPGEVASAAGTLSFALPEDTLRPSGGTLTATLSSYASPAAATRVVERGRSEVATCPRWSEPAPFDDDGAGQLWAVAIPAPAGLPEQTFHSRRITSGSVGGLPAAVGAGRIVVAFGHNVITAEAEQGIPFRASLVPPEQQLLDTLAVNLAQRVIHALDP